MKMTKKPIRCKKSFSRKVLKSGLSKKLFAEEKNEAEQNQEVAPSNEAENDAKAQLAGMLDPSKCDDAVVKAFAEACALDEEQAKQLVKATEDATKEGTEAQMAFFGKEYDDKIREASLKFSRKARRILGKNFAEGEAEEKAVDSEILVKDVAVILKALDAKTFEVKNAEEIAAVIEAATELPSETTIALLSLKDAPVVEEKKEEVKEEESKEEEAKEENKESELSTFARHKALQRARMEFARKRQMMKKFSKKENPSRKKIPVEGLDMRDAIKPSKENKMRNLTDKLEEVRAFSRKKHFAEMLRKKRLARAKKMFAEPDAFEPRYPAEQNPDKPTVAQRSERPHGHLNSTVASRLRSLRQSEATKARDTKGRIEDLSAVPAGESLAEMNEMAVCPNTRFARHNRITRNVKNDDEFKTLRELLGDKLN